MTWILLWCLHACQLGIGVRAIFGRGGGKPFAQKILASCPNFYTGAIRCNNIGRTGIRKCLNTVFQGQYIPAKLEHKLYVAINKHLEKLPPQLYYMKICHDQGCNDIGVVIATKWRHYLGLWNRSRELFPPIVASMFVKLNGICESVIGIFWDKVFIVRNRVKQGKSWCLAVICRKWSAFDMQFHLIIYSFNRFKNVCELF